MFSRISILPQTLAASAAEPVDFFASLASPAPAAAVPPAATADDVFPFDFGGGSGGGSNSGSGGGFGSGSGGDGADRQRPDQPKKRRNLLWLKITLPIVIVLGLVGGGAAYVWLNYETQVREFMGWQLPNDYEGAGNGEEAIVTIQSGDLGSDVANTLKDAGVTMTFDAFYDLLLAQPDNVNFLPGNYALQKQMSAQAALDALLDPANKVTSKLLITEGTTLPSALEIIAETTGIPLADVQAAAADPTVYGVPAWDGRRGGDGAPWYVAGKDLATNTLLVVQVHDDPRLFSASLRALDASWISGSAPSAGEALAAKTRYRQADAPCRFSGGEDGRFTLDFPDPQWAVTPGQSAVLYRGEECLGGGVIS